jgi:hypothetical protein
MGTAFRTVRGRGRVYNPGYLENGMHNPRTLTGESVMVSRSKTPARMSGPKVTASARAASASLTRKKFSECIRKGHPELQAVAQAIRRLVKRLLPASIETINPWGIPTFSLHGPIALLMVGKHHLTLGFTRGTSLDDPTRLLDGTGKNLRHVKLRELVDVRNPSLGKLILYAANLNRATPLTDSMRPEKSKTA